MNKYDIYRLVRNELSVYFPVYSFFARRNGAFLVKDSTDLVIEGFPRSANSFLETALRITLKPPFSLAHHTHARSQVESAVSRGIPCLVLVRNPIDAIVSYLEENEKLSSPNVLLREYVIFYRKISKHDGNVKFISFESVVGNCEKVVQDIALWGNLPLIDDASKLHDPKIVFDELTLNAFKRVGIIPAYRRTKTKKQQLNREKLRAEIRDRVEVLSSKRLTNQANRVYQEISKFCVLE